MRTWEQVKAEGAEMVRAHRYAWFEELRKVFGAKFMAARAVNMDRTSFTRLAGEVGYSWVEKKPPVRKAPQPTKPVLSEEQRADVRLMMDKGYKEAEAIAAVTAPRAKVSLYLKPDASQEPRSASSRPQVAPLRVRLTANPQRACTGVSGGVR